MIKTFFILVFISSGQSEFDMQPVAGDDMNAAMTAENCQEAADDMNETEDGNVYWCVKVFHTDRHRKL